MNVEKDALLLSLTWDIEDETTCMYKECPRYGWILFAMGFHSEKLPMAYKLCPTHCAEMLEDWHSTFLPKVMEDFKKCDRKDYGLE